MEVIYSASKVEQINDYLFILDTYKSNKIKTGMNKTSVNDSEMSRPNTEKSYACISYGHVVRCG